MHGRGRMYGHMLLKWLVGQVMRQKAGNGGARQGGENGIWGILVVKGGLPEHGPLWAVGWRGST